GAAAGTVYASQMSQNIRIPENSTVKIVTTQPLPITPAYPQQRQPYGVNPPAPVSPPNPPVPAATPYH
ncbi:MAG: hypothetical protein JO101_04200, partial [Candidatus Eremiobacteraeota bacterium]|nr:hypothetical protein [Candidatus Eremiobacteraeota bacterium]